MNRKLTSILLLLNFLVLVFHEMIPHHHVQNTFSKTDVSQCIEANHHSAHNHSISEFSVCEAQHEHVADKHTECPHHYHNCTIEHLKYNSTNKSISTRQWKRPLNIYSSEFNNTSEEYIDCTENDYSDVSFLLSEGSRLSVISLRAPPTFT